MKQPNFLVIMSQGVQILQQLWQKSCFA